MTNSQGLVWQTNKPNNKLEKCYLPKKNIPKNGGTFCKGMFISNFMEGVSSASGVLIHSLSFVFLNSHTFSCL